MATKNWNAGIIRPVPVAPAGPYQDGAAPGVWTLDQVAYWLQQGLWPIAGNAPRALIAGGYTSTGRTNVINTVVITTVGNATDFGDLLSETGGLAGFSSNTRGVFAGGTTGTVTNVIQYVTIASAGNATDFGDLLITDLGPFGYSNSTRGVISGGADAGSTNSNVIQYVTIATTGNATDFGDLTQARTGTGGGCSSSTRGLVGGGVQYGTGANYNIIDYTTIASTGNAIDFGDLTSRGSSEQDTCGSVASDTRAVWGGGYGSATSSNVMDYVTIATTGNATDFGDLTVGRQNPAGAASSLRGLFCAGYATNYSNIIDYITIASVGNATDFGDLTYTATQAAACSSATAAVQP